MFNDRLSIKLVTEGTFYTDISYIPGHMLTLHVRSSTFFDPSILQGNPPCIGVGLRHKRCRFCIPPPQDTVHPPHSCQLLQSPKKIVFECLVVMTTDAKKYNIDCEVQIINNHVPPLGVS